MSDDKIPVLDLLQLGLCSSDDISSKDLKTVGEKLAEAFAHIGFAYITNHGVPEDVVELVMRSSDEFFQSSREAKEKWSKVVGTDVGYVTIDREKLSSDPSKVELRESFDIKSRNGLMPDDLVPSFRPSINVLVDHLCALTNTLLRALAHGLDLPDKETFVDCHKGLFQEKNGTALRVLNYPPVPAESSTTVLRCGAHTDYGTITILMQDTMGGLEVRARSGEWVQACPIPGAMLINVGDLLQRWTNDRLVATEHRVLVPSNPNSLRSVRRSIVFFVHPDDDVVVAPITTDQKGPHNYSPIGAKEYLQSRFKNTYQY